MEEITNNTQITTSDAATITNVTIGGNLDVLNSTNANMGDLVVIGTADVTATNSVDINNSEISDLTISSLIANIANTVGAKAAIPFISVFAAKPFKVTPIIPIYTIQ